MVSRNPVRILKNEAEEEEDEVARLSLLAGAIAIDDSIKSTLGSKGMDKILVAHGHNSGEVQVTNDRAKILKNVGVNNPAAKIPVDMSQVQDNEVDDTETVIVLATKYLEKAEEIIKRRYFPQTITTRWRQIATVARKALQNAAAGNSADLDHFRKDIMTIGRSMSSPNLVSQVTDCPVTPWSHRAYHADVRKNMTNLPGYERNLGINDDGTKAVIVLATKYLEEAGEIIKRGYFPQIITTRWRQIATVARKALQNVAAGDSVDLDRFRKDIMTIGRSISSPNLELC